MTPVEDGIFDKFKSLRFDIASKNEIPAYIVFSDKTLLEFAQKLPQTKDDMLDVNGVGEVKYERYGEDVLALCKELNYDVILSYSPLQGILSSFHPWIKPSSRL